jgi:plastocyanin
MKIVRQNVHCLQAVAVLFFVLALSVFSAQATTHTIQFGGEVGLNYLPNQLNVSVGDTVRWVGSFSFHPLSSTSVPQGANSFSSSAGSTFSYVVPVAGTYNFHCTVHAVMTGSFTAGVSAVSPAEIASQPSSFNLVQNYPNPFNARTMIKFNLPAAQRVELTIYSITGAEIATLIDGYVPAGEFTVPFEAGNLSSGVYFYQLVSENHIETKRLVLTK